VNPEKKTRRLDRAFSDYTVSKEGKVRELDGSGYARSLAEAYNASGHATDEPSLLITREER
jgi:hypothetical protein